MMEKNIISNFLKRIYFLKKIFICFINVETDLRLWYYMLACSLQINVGEGLELGVGTRYFHIRNMAFSGGGQATI
jgi:ACR3 family arsenite efflux pump ArsB